MVKKIILLFKFLMIAVYCVAGAELFLRLFAPVPILPRRVCAMPYGIRGNKPNQTYWQRTPECKVQIHTNSKGIRTDREIPYEKARGVARIVLLGDSFGMGYEVDYKDMFSTKLEYFLHTQYGINAEVINLSTSGHGNAEELIVLQNEGLKYNPDIVILSWHTTDYDDNVRSNLYGLQNGELVKLNDQYLPAVETRAKLENIPLYIEMEENSHFYTFIRELAAVKIKALLATFYSVQQKPQNMSGPETSGNYSKELTLALLKQIEKTCRDHQIKFMIFDVPVRKDRVTFFSDFPLMLDEAKKSFFFYSPIEDFKKANGEKVFWECGHGHFTPLGCQIVGQELAEEIKKNGFLTK